MSAGRSVQVSLLLATQTAFVAFLGILKTHQAGLRASFYFIVAHVYGAVYGLIRGPRFIRLSGLDALSSGESNRWIAARIVRIA
jgi:hypothetical protein